MESRNSIRTYRDATAIVTGAASGIGRGLAEELAKRGCEVILADLQIEAAEKIALEINSTGGKATAAELNVTDFSRTEQVVTETVNRTGRLDYIFNNAGIGIVGNAYNYTIEDWNQIVNINLFGVINGVQAAYQVMKKQGFGHIVNTSSLAGILPTPGNVAYSSTKHAVVGLSGSLRAEASMYGVRVSVLCPGFVRTAIFDNGGKFGKSVINFSSEQKRKYMESFEKYKPMPADIYAAKALDLIAKNKAIIVFPIHWRLLWFFCRLFPTLAIKGSRKPFFKAQEEIANN